MICTCDAIALTGRGFYLVCHRSQGHTTDIHYDMYMDATWCHSVVVDSASRERVERGEALDAAVSVTFRNPPKPQEEGMLW